MKKINEEYTGRTGTTDVLSFPLGLDHNKRSIYEILISLDRAKKQALEKRVTLFQEVIRLLVHAVVHLTGYDHHNDKGFKEMRKKEIELLLRVI